MIPYLLAALLIQQPKIALTDGGKCVRVEYANGNAGIYCRTNDTFDVFTLDGKATDGTKIRQVKRLGDCNGRTWKDGDVWVYESCTPYFSLEYNRLKSQESDFRNRAEKSGFR